jgi:hypothetical protein
VGAGGCDASGYPAPEKEGAKEKEVALSAGAASLPIPTSKLRVLSGLLEFLDGAGGVPIAGAPILIQVRAASRKGEVVTERMLAETTTDSAGRWELYATPIGKAGRRRDVAAGPLFRRSRVRRGRL